MCYEKVNEKDWNLFREKIVIWQHSYMEALNKEYISILSSDAAAEDKFWKLEKRINKDKRSAGTAVEMKRSRMYSNLIMLLDNGIISLEDLDGFSDELKESLEFLFRRPD